MSRRRVAGALFLCALLCGARPSLEYDEYHKGASDSLRSRAGAVNEKELDPAYWAEEARAGIERLVRGGAADGGGVARNVVLFLGDGMSVPTLAAARALLGQRRNHTGEEAQLFFETFPTVGLAKTYCVDAQIADSACSATAYLCGAKANKGTIGVSARVPRCHIRIVTTTRVTHASPAGAYAHTAERNWESDADVAAACGAPAQPDIAHQLVHGYPGTHLKVILGGGRREFLPNTVIDEEGTVGRRLDDRNLIKEWEMDKISRNVSYQYVWNREQLSSANAEPPEYLLGLFEGSHLHYNMQADPATEPSLADLTEAAIRSLSRNEKGFFLFVEGGRIDHAHHENYVELALDETIELAAAVERAAQLLEEDDSLLVVTSDHAHVMAFSGYTQRGGDILGPSDDRGDDDIPYMTLSYANGPGHRAHAAGARPDVTREADYRALQWRSHADVPLDSETHGGDDVAVFARGPHHAMFAGLYEQSQLPHRMAYVACFGSGATLCDNK